MPKDGACSSMTCAQEGDLGEALRMKGVEAVILIRESPSRWASAARWFRDLPIPRAVKERRLISASSENNLSGGGATERDEGGKRVETLPAAIEFELVDVEEDTNRRLGPTVRRLIAAWEAAGERFFRLSRVDRYYDFGEDDALRVVLLAALTFNRDFDGAELGLQLPWEHPESCTSSFEGRNSAWALITSSRTAEPRLLELIGIALDYATRVPQSRTPVADVVERDSEDGAETLRLGRETDPAKTIGNEEFRPATWFRKGMAARLRMAARPDRKTKRVRSHIIDGVVCYCVEDARRWWPQDLPKDAQRGVAERNDP